MSGSVDEISHSHQTKPQNSSPELIMSPLRLEVGVLGVQVSKPDEEQMGRKERLLRTTLKAKKRKRSVNVEEKAKQYNVSADEDTLHKFNIVGHLHQLKELTGKVSSILGKSENILSVFYFSSTLCIILCPCLPDCMCAI